MNDYTLTLIEAEEISATDLQAEATSGTKSFECYRIQSSSTAETGWMIFSSEAGRAGIAWGADAQWTDACDEDDAMERFLGLNGKEMDN